MKTEKENFIMQTVPLDNITMQPRKLYRYRFRTSHVFIEGPEKGQEKTWKRNTGIMYTGKVNRLHHFHLLCYNTEFSNGAAGPAFNLIKEISYIFNDLRICLNNEGKIVTIKNLKKIKERWNREREKLESFNRGISVENYFNFLSRLLDDEQEITDYLLSYEMYGMFFNGTLLGSLNTGDIFSRKVNSTYKNAGFLEEWKKEQHTNESEESYFRIIGKPEDDKENDNAFQYKGNFIYSSGFLLDGSLEMLHNNNHKKYTVLWVG